MRKVIYIGLFALALLLVYCNAEPAKDNSWVKEKFLNMNDSVTYVGMNTCLSCHKDIHDSYIHTGMGQSFDNATREKSAAIFGEHAVVYDKYSDFYYKPYFKDSTLYVDEYRLVGTDTVHKRTEEIAYIIGSGHHTNSHMLNRNGYVYQAPITFYTQDKKWDLAPGFEEGNNSRFGRLIATECLTCHNHFPKHVAGSENKYLAMPTGIECERCHGPGSLHVQEKLRGNIVDTSKYADYTIVNPRHLPIDLQMDLCQRCHLQGVAVLNEGKTFFDFRPGMALSEVMQVYLPRFTNSHEKFIMASQADRLRLSPCYLESGKLSCITCHNPHHDVKSREQNRYNEACLSCHGGKQQSFCSAPAPERQLENDDCVYCHMPRSGSIDIPHVNITDHNIRKSTVRKREISQEDKEQVAKFLGLEALTTQNPEPLEVARGYLALYDKFMQVGYVLDSASYYLNQVEEESRLYLQTRIHFYFIKQDYKKITDLALAHPPASIRDGWTAYRIGEAYYRQDNFTKANQYFAKAVEYRKYNLDFQEKLAVTFARLNNLARAREVLNFVLQEDGKRPLALVNLGYMAAQEGKLETALYYYDKTLNLDPDYETALMNKVAILIHQKKILEARKVLQHLVDKHPNNQQAKQVLESL